MYEGAYGNAIDSVWSSKEFAETVAENANNTSYFYHWVEEREIGKE